MTFIRIIIVTRRHSFWLLSYVHGDSMIQHSIILYTYVTITYIHGVDSLPSFQLPLAPLAVPSLLSFVPLFHLLGALQL
jgi:hypothetical protein